MNVSITQSQFQQVKKSFTFHYSSCELYRNFCDNSGFNPSSLQSPEDVLRIPLIPTQMFKTYDIRSVPEEEIVKVCTSSGTRGSISRVARDAKSLQSFIAGTAERIAVSISPNADEYSLLCLSPQEDGANNLWMSYIIDLMGKITAKQRYYVADNKFMLHELIADLKVAQQTYEKVALIGPPVFFVYLYTALQNADTKLRLHRESYVLTMGGWKRDEDKAVSRSELEENISEVLGLAPIRFRDGYGAVELNTVVFDCANKHMHLPDWTIAIARDTENLHPLEYGEEGILSFIDTSANSYPCFILTEDFGTVYQEASCGCSVPGDYIKISRRVNTVESKGCALKMSSMEVEGSDKD